MEPREVSKDGLELWDAHVVREALTQSKDQMTPCDRVRSRLLVKACVVQLGCVDGGRLGSRRMW